jgi:hypothetical protein
MQEDTASSIMCSWLSTDARRYCYKHYVLLFERRCKRILQTILTLDSLRKAQSTAVTGTMDLSQVDTRTLYQALPYGLHVSLRKAKSEVVFADQGYSLQFTLPKFSKEYGVYSLRQVPLYTQGHWYLLTNMAPVIAVNDNHDMITESDLVAYCELDHDVYFCPAHDITIRKSAEQVCSVQLITSFATGIFVYDSCVSEKILLVKEQMYLLKNNDLFIANPLDSDLLVQDCPLHKNDSEPRPLSLGGLNLITRDPTCHLETSQLIISNADSNPDILDFNLTLAESELSLVTELESTRTFLEKGVSVDFTPFDRMAEVLKVYQNTVSVNLKTVEELHNEVTKINGINTLNNFVPLDISRYMSSDDSGAFNFLDYAYYAHIGVGLVLLLLVIKNLLPDGCCKATFSCCKWLVKGPERPTVPQTSVQFRRAANKQAEDEIELGTLGNQGVASSTLSQYSPWSYVRDKTGSLIISQVLDSNLIVQYDLNLNTVVDFNNRVYPKIPAPSPVAVAQYLETVARTRLPPLVLDSSGTRHLRDFPTIKYLPPGGWFDSSTSKKNWGLRHPQPEDN